MVAMRIPLPLNDGQQDVELYAATEQGNLIAVRHLRLAGGRVARACSNSHQESCSGSS